MTSILPQAPWHLRAPDLLFSEKGYHPEPASPWRWTIFPFTQDHCLALRKDSQLIQRLFRTHFLDDSDHRIDHNNSHEHGVLIGTNQQYHNHQSQVQKVEKCKHILPYDLLIAPCVGVLINIDFPLFNSLLYPVRLSVLSSLLPSFLCFI